MQSTDAQPWPGHFDGTSFFNPGAPQARGFSDFLRWQFSSRSESSPEFVNDVTPTKPPASIESGELRVTLINHSTVLLQQHGLNILTDPIWSERCSPIASIGPRRHRVPGVNLPDLPRIDIVLLSHDHYDHLDLPTLHQLKKRGFSQFIVPLGVAALLKAEGIGPATELDWGQSTSVPAPNPATIHAVPAQHFSGRSLFNRNQTLWCGYLIEFAGRVIYFAGDTAFNPHFAHIRERFGAPDLALLPIGAYEPRWFMSPVHMNPADAVRAHQILQPRATIAIHHGTFALADEALDTPRRDFAAADPGPSFTILNNGEHLTLE